MSRNQVEDVRRDGDQILLRLVGAPVGTWLTYDSGIDALLAHIARELGIAGRGAKTMIIASLAIEHSAISRCRHGQSPIMDGYILRMHEFSGIPVGELRWVGCVDGLVARHKNARPSRPVAGILQGLP